MKKPFSLWACAISVAAIFLSGPNAAAAADTTSPQLTREMYQQHLKFVETAVQGLGSVGVAVALELGRPMDADVAVVTSGGVRNAKEFVERWVLERYGAPPPHSGDSQPGLWFHISYVLVPHFHHAGDGSKELQWHKLSVKAELRSLKRTESGAAHYVTALRAYSDDGPGVKFKRLSRERDADLALMAAISSALRNLSAQIDTHRRSR